MATNWWEIGKPVQDFEPVAQEKKEQNWWEIGKPVEEPVVKPVAAPPAPESTGLRGFGEGVAATFENIIPTIGERFKQFGFGVTSRAVDRLPDSINIPPPGVPIEDIDRAGGVREYYAQVYGINSDEDLRKVKEESTRRTTARVEASQQRIAELTPEDLNLVQRGVRGGVESLAVMTPAVLASLATRSPVPGLAGAGALEGFGSYAEARAEGKDPNAALAYGGVNAAIEVATELIPGKRLLDALKVKDKGELKDVLLKFAAGEFLGEQAATAGQSLNALAAGLDQELANAKTPEEFARIQGERQAVTAISTIVAGGTQAAGIGAINKVREEVARRDIETQVRDLEEVGSDMERQRIDEIRTQALEDAQSIAAPKQNEIALDEGQAEPTPEQYGDNYAQKVYDSIGQYIPANAEFKVEQKTIDGVPRFVVTDKEGIQYGQTLDDRAKADSFALSLNNTTKSRAELLKQLEPLQSSLKDTLKGFGLNDMGLTLSDRIFTRRGEALTSEGLFDPVVRRVFLAVDAVDPQGTLDTTQRREALRGVLRHEVVHALRYLDLWKRSEWKNLEKTVSKLKKPGTDKTYLQIAQENYGDQNKVVQVEEGVADLIRDVAGNLSKVAGKPRSLSERAINFFDKAKNAVTGAGFQTYEDIVQKFEQGDIGARQRGRIRTFRATEERQAEQGQLPERVQRLFTNPEQRNQFRQEVAQNLQTQVPATNQPALNSLRLNAVRESRSTIDPVPPKIRVDEQEVPTRDSEGRLIYSGYEGPEVFGIQTRPTQEGLQNFWRWFGKSKAADKDKRPLVYYHGTAADITEFRPKQAGSVFITRSPSFAKTFSDLSSEYMIDNFTDFMSNQEVLNVLNESMRSSTTPNFYDKLEAIQKKASTLIEKGEPLSSSLLSSIKDLYQESGVSSKMVESIRSRMPSNANIVPVYVKADNPFDYENKQHIKDVLKRINETSALELDSGQIEGLKKGDWTAVESPLILNAIKSLGFDSMYVEEMDEKNLAVFNPNQIKSAVGNTGDFSPLTPSIREARRKEPISPLQAIITPEEAEGRIRRRMEREPGVGAPRNERIEFTSPDGKRLVVGKITTQDWLDRVTQLLSMTEIQDARAWYRQLSDALRPIYGPDSSKWALAWLMSQKRASPTKGFTDVLRASDIARGKAKVKGAGLNEQALIDILQDKVPEGGIGAKLLDFLDSELGKVTRTVVRGDVRGRQPAAIDVWAQRDIGFIDETTLEFIRKVFGEQAANQLQVDKTTGGETQYEYGIDFYNNVAEMLNEANFDGGGWTAAEVQAVGWVTMQRAMGIQAEFVRDIIGGNTRRISIGLAPGANSILADKLAGKEIPPEVAQREIQTLADLAGIKVKQNVAGVGAYLQWVEGAIQIDAVASPEAVDDFMDMVGYVFQQTEVINTRSLPSGKNMAIDIMAPAFATVDGSTSFFSKFLNYAPKDKNGDPLAPGFQQINIDGMPGIRFLNFGGNWRKQQVNEIIDAANKTADDLDVDLGRTIVSQVVLTSTKNDWSEKKDGEAYLSSLRDRGRLQEVELLQRRYPPSRIDIQGDGSILWGEREAAEDARLAGQAEAVTPRAREARPTRAGPTQPGPSTDRDDTSAADALNLGEPINSMGIATGPQITDTMPDGTVDISRARLEPLTKRLIRGVEFIQSAPDKLRGGVGLGDIAKRIEDYYDGYAAKLGLVNDIIRDAFNQIPRRNRESALNTFEQYIRARENNRTAEAQQIFASASPEDRQLISAWDQISRETGRINLSVTTPDGDPMKVWDSKVGAWRPIRAVQQFFPRTLRKEVMEVMKNPDLDPALWDSLLDSLVNAGRAESRQAAEDYLIREWFSDEIKQDYFAGVEKARSEPLPEVFYDYSWDAATRYLRKWARRTSQIENFGQELGQFKKDWFGTNIPKVRDQETQNYLNAIRERIYEIESFDTLTNIANWANSLATATQLGNPISASLNLLGGTITNVQEFGIRQIAKSYIDLALDWKNVQKEGTTLGILNRDFMNILNDHVEMDADKYFSKEQKISQALAKFANATLTFGGFNGAENIVRASAMLAARSWLNDSLKAVNTDPTSARAKKFYTWINRENLDANALILENGAGPETDKYMRRAVNVPQGSYNIDMTPVFIDTPAGRFLLKYQKFGTQINRFFYRHFLKPFMDEPTPANFLRVAGFLGGAIVGGGAILAIREAFGYGDPGPDDEEIKKAFEKKDSERAWSLIFSRAWQNIMAAGSGGFFANYAQFAMDWQDQQRVKNPFSPPGLASVDAVIDVFNRMRDQGKLTARDLDEIAENVLSFYRANKRIGLATLEAVGADYREVKRFSAQKEIREVREYGRRYSEEMEIEFKRRTAPGAPIRTPMTPVNKAIADALAQGDSGRARLLYREAIRGLPPKEREKVRASVNASVRNRQPIQIGGNAPNKQERAAFLKWARQNLPAEKYQLILRTDRRYRLSAQRAGLGFSE